MTLTRRAFLEIGAAGVGLAAAKLLGLDEIVGDTSAHQLQKPQQQKPNLYALLIYPRNSAPIFRDVCNFLREQGFGEDSIESLYLLGPETEWQVQRYIPHIKIKDGATRSGLYNSANRLKRKVSPQDNLFIYFQHHGVLDRAINNGEPSIELRWENPRDNNYFVPVSEFANIIRQIPARRIVLLTGQCYASDFGVRFRELLPDREVTVFSFAPPNEKAYDTETDISRMFGTTFVRVPVLKDKQYDTNNDGHVSLAEAAKALEKRRTANKPNIIGSDFYFSRKL